MVKGFGFALFLMMAVALSSCTYLAVRFGEKPEVALEQVYIKDANFLAATLVFVLDVKNPNRIDLNIDRVDYDIQLDGQSFAKTSIDQKIVLKSESVTKVEVPLPFQYLQLAGGLAKALQGQDVVYVFSGNAKVSGLSVPFTQKGVFNMNSLLGRKADSPSH
ncbi:MAG TPA: LEA type 2 family protein [Bdellovibrio sp.]|uniref:LEA type 2 family protein n=1 Tax=Bdellovibrio sp. TaxID=28201 RepID=UPI002EEA62B3